jgi:hypothetical protein
MANVAKSAHVRDQIMHKIRLLYTPRLKEAELDYGGKSRADLAEILYKAWFEDKEIKMMREINKLSQFNERTYGGSNPHFQDLPAIKLIYKGVSYEFPLLPSRILPRGVAGQSYNMRYEDLPSVPEFEKAMEFRLKNMNDVAEEQSSLEKEFYQLWDKVSSVNQLCAVWPAAIQLLEGISLKNGGYVLAEMQKKVERNTAKTVLGEVDISTLNSKLLTAKIAA